MFPNGGSKVITKFPGLDVSLVLACGAASELLASFLVVVFSLTGIM